MSFIPKAIGAFVSPLANALGAFGKKPKAPKPVYPLPQVTPRSVAASALSDRRGSQANRRTGSGGAESATTGKKDKLGQ